MVGIASLAHSAGRDVLLAAQTLRRDGCATRPGTRAPLVRSAPLDRVAAAWAQGGTLAQALQRTGVRARRSASLRVGNTGSFEHSLLAGLCTPLTTAEYASLGVFTGRTQTWVVVAQLFTPPDTAGAPRIARETLALVNAARAHPRRCGKRNFAAAPPLRASALLDKAALVHARDQAQHSLLSHSGTDRSDPGTRASRAGYHWRVIGENVAAGPQSAAEAVAGWLDSPDHCENIMDPRYREMGIAYAVNPLSSGFIYWSQTFGLPR